MQRRQHVMLLVLFVMTGMMAGGCTTVGSNAVAPDRQMQSLSEKVQTLESQLAQVEEERNTATLRANTLAEELEEAGRRADQCIGKAEDCEKKLTDALIGPPDAQPNTCYARLSYPPGYSPRTKRVVLQEAATEVEIIPEAYRTVEKQVLVQGERVHVVRVEPAKYETKTERIKVREAGFRIEVLRPGHYKSVSERVLVKPSGFVWKPQESLIYGPFNLQGDPGRIYQRRTDPQTGDVWCLVEVLAQYRTVTKKVYVEPETRRVDFPALYKTVTQRVMVSPPKLITETLPAEYKTLVTKELAREPEEREVVKPAVMGTVMEQILDYPARMEWGAVFCQVNFTEERVRELQAKLGSYYADLGGMIDGIYGTITAQAVGNYQREHNLPQGGLTYEVLDMLDINWPRERN